MAAVRELSHLVLGVKDLKAWDDYATDILGFQLARKTDSSREYRLDDRLYRIRLERDDVDDLLALGWEVATSEDLDAVCRQLADAGFATEHSSQSSLDARGVVRMVQVKGPRGVQHEICVGHASGGAAAFHSPRAIAGFVTGDQGLGHITQFVESYDAAVSFYHDGLGMRLSQLGKRPEMNLVAPFFRCNPRQHSIACAPVNAPKRLHHVMTEMVSLTDLGKTYDLVQERGIPLIMTLGEHTGDHMTSFYMATPSGFAWEVGWQGRRMQDGDPVEVDDTGSVWGHKPGAGAPRH